VTNHLIRAPVHRSRSHEKASMQLRRQVHRFLRLLNLKITRKNQKALCFLLHTALLDKMLHQVLRQQLLKLHWHGTIYFRAIRH